MFDIERIIAVVNQRLITEYDEWNRKTLYVDKKVALVRAIEKR